jgi:hypothetical protein
MTARNRLQFEVGQARPAEVLSMLERYPWRESLADVPAAKTIREEMKRVPLPAYPQQ